MISSTDLSCRWYRAKVRKLQCDFEEPYMCIVSVSIFNELYALGAIQTMFTRFIPLTKGSEVVQIGSIFIGVKKYEVS